FPDAFRFEYDGREGELIKLKFAPNPDFHGSGRAAQVFHHLEGTMLVDPEQKRLAEITGELTSEVRFGWGGILGHLDEGGTFHVKLADLGSGHWEMTTLDVEMDGKALLFKTDRKSTRLNSSHRTISYAVFCLKKKKKKNKTSTL